MASCFERKFSDEEIVSAYREAGNIAGASRLCGADRKTIRLTLPDEVRRPTVHTLR